MAASTHSKSVGRLLQWYDKQHRELPWRSPKGQSANPYEVWVSEIMLQQTQVQTVIPYFETFVAQYPTVEALAAAPLEEVLARWSGLGYYRRARQLHRAAGEIVEGGGFPTTADGLRELPGIGEYTAAAVASIAFGEVVPVLDGNVERVLSRRLAQDEDPKRSRPRRRLRRAAAELLDPERPGDSNQALMELGATVCRPTSPDCAACPLTSGCRAHLEGDPERYPPARKRRTSEQRFRIAAVVESEAGLLFFRRPPDAEIMPDLWEFPNVATVDDLHQVEAALALAYGGRWTLGEALGTVRHSITYRRFEITVHRARRDTVAGEVDIRESTFVPRKQRPPFATSSLIEKISKLLSR